MSKRRALELGGFLFDKRLAAQGEVHFFDKRYIHTRFDPANGQHESAVDIKSGLVGSSFLCPTTGSVPYCYFSAECATFSVTFLRLL